MSSDRDDAVSKYITPNDDGSYTVYNNAGQVALVTKNRLTALMLAQRFEQEAAK